MFKKLKKAKFIKKILSFYMALALSLGGMPLIRVNAEGEKGPQVFAKPEDLQTTWGDGGILENGSKQYIYFGSYPKTEVSAPAGADTAAWSKVVSKETTKKNPDGLMSDLRGFYDGDDATINGVKYRRVDMNYVDIGYGGATAEQTKQIEEANAIIAAVEEKTKAADEANKTAKETAALLEGMQTLENIGNSAKGETDEALKQEMDKNLKEAEQKANEAKELAENANKALEEAKKAAKQAQKDKEALVEKITGNITPAYKYFKYEPIRWRILSKQHNVLSLMADETLDYKQYCAPIYDGSVKDNEKPKLVPISYEDSDIVEWLSGFSDTGTGGSIFYNYAFSDAERAAITKGTFASKDWYTYVNLPKKSTFEQSGNGFNTSLGSDHASRKFNYTGYANAMNDYFKNASDENLAVSASGFLIRQLSSDKTTECPTFAKEGHYSPTFTPKDKPETKLYNVAAGVCPVININLSSDLNVDLTKKVVSFASSVPVSVSDTTDVKEISDTKAMYFHLASSDKVNKILEKFVSWSNTQLSFKLQATTADEKVVICAHGGRDRNVTPYYAATAAPIATTENPGTVTFTGDMYNICNNYFVEAWVENKNGEIVGVPVTINEPSASVLNQLSDDIQSKVEFNSASSKAPEADNLKTCDIRIKDMPVKRGGIAGLFEKQYAYYVNEAGTNESAVKATYKSSTNTAGQDIADILFSGLKYNTKYELQRIIGDSITGATDKVEFTTPAYEWSSAETNVTVESVDQTSATLKFTGNTDNIDGYSFSYAAYDSDIGNDISDYIQKAERILPLEKGFKISNLSCGSNYEIIVWQAASADQIKIGYAEKSNAIKSEGNDYFIVDTTMPSGDYQYAIPDAPEILKVKGENGVYQVTLKAKAGFEYGYAFRSTDEPGNFVTATDDGEITLTGLKIAELVASNSNKINEGTYNPYAYIFARKKAGNIAASLLSDPSTVMFIPDVVSWREYSINNIEKDFTNAGNKTAVVVKNGDQTTQFARDLTSGGNTKVWGQKETISSTDTTITVSGLVDPRRTFASNVHLIAIAPGFNTEVEGGDSPVVAADTEINKGNGTYTLTGLKPGVSYILAVVGASGPGDEGALTIGKMLNLQLVNAVNRFAVNYTLVTTAKGAGVGPTDYVLFGDKEFMAESNDTIRANLQDAGVNYSILSVVGSNKGEAIGTDGFKYGYCQRGKATEDSNPAKVARPAFVPAPIVKNVEVKDGQQEITLEVKQDIEIAVVSEKTLNEMKQKPEEEQAQNTTFVSPTNLNANVPVIVTGTKENATEMKITIDQNGQVGNETIAPGGNLIILARQESMDNVPAGKVNVTEPTKVVNTIASSDPDHKFDYNKINEFVTDHNYTKVIAIPANTLLEGTRLAVLKDNGAGALNQQTVITVEKDKPVNISLYKTNSLTKYYVVAHNTNDLKIGQNTTIAQIQSDNTGAILSQAIEVPAVSPISETLTGQQVFDRYLNSASLKVSGSNVLVNISPKEGYTAYIGYPQPGKTLGDTVRPEGLSIPVDDLQKSKFIYITVRNKKNTEDSVVIGVNNDSNTLKTDGAELKLLIGDTELVLKTGQEAQKDLTVTDKSVTLIEKKDQDTILLSQQSNSTISEVSKSPDTVTNLQENSTLNVAVIEPNGAVTNYNGIQTAQKEAEIQIGGKDQTQVQVEVLNERPVTTSIQGVELVNKILPAATVVKTSDNIIQVKLPEQNVSSSVQADLKLVKTDERGNQTETPIVNDTEIQTDTLKGATIVAIDKRDASAQYDIVLDVPKIEEIKTGAIVPITDVVPAEAVKLVTKDEAIQCVPEPTTGKIDLSKFTPSDSTHTVKVLYKASTDTKWASNGNNLVIEGLKAGKAYDAKVIELDTSNKAVSITMVQAIPIADNAASPQLMVSIEEATEKFTKNLSMSSKSSNEIIDVGSFFDNFTKNLPEEEVGVVGAIAIEPKEPGALTGSYDVTVNGLLSDKATVLSKDKSTNTVKKETQDIDLDKKQIELVGKYSTDSGKEVYLPLGTKSTVGDTVTSSVPMEILDKESGENAKINSVVQVVDDKPAQAKNSLDIATIVLVSAGSALAVGGIAYGAVYFYRRRIV